MVYKNIFTGLLRKFDGNVALASNDNGATWTKSGTPLELIKKLPYYVEVKNG